jgi:hypothetical protein
VEADSGSSFPADVQDSAAGAVVAGADAGMVQAVWHDPGYDTMSDSAELRHFSRVRTQWLVH